MISFLQYSSKRRPCGKMFNAYINRGSNSGENDNKEVVRGLITARLVRAKLTDHDDCTSFVLEDYMAKNSDKVCQLLDRVWKPTLARTRGELANMDAEIKKEGNNFKVED